MAYSPAQIAHTKGGDPFLIDLHHADLARQFTFAANSWGNYKADGTLTVGTAITPTFDGAGFSQGGNYFVSIPLFTIPTYNSAHITFDVTGSGVSVAYSLDNQQSWTPITDYTVVPLTSANATIDIRANFVGGGQGDTSALNSISVYVFKAGVITQESGTRKLTIGQEQITADGLVTGSAGCTVSSAAGGGTLDPQGPAQIGAVNYNVGTIEAWVTLTPGSSVFPGLPAATLYTNGVAGVPNPNSTSPQHVVAVLTTPANVGFTVGANLTVSHFATYQAQLTVTDIATLYESAVNGMPTITINDTAGITVTENSPAVDVYAYNWSIVSVGH